MLGQILIFIKRHFTGVNLVEVGVGVVPLAQEDLWKLSSDKREVFFLFIAIYCLISTQTYRNQRVKIAGL